MNQNRFRRSNGGRIDRSRPLQFVFDGRRYEGFKGDTLASALLANGVRLFGRSFKYHRPRGLLAAGVEEPNALVTVGTGDDRTPNIPATVVELTDGLVAESQNRWPSLSFDWMAINSLAAPLLPAGFYYKSLMGPTRRAWMLYEHFIRRAAGLGRASDAPDPNRYEFRHDHCDVLVVGGGPAGLGAAFAAGQAHARVLIVEQDFELGGSLLAEPADSAASAWLKRTISALQALANVRVMTRTTAFGLYDGGTVGLLERREQESPDQASGRASQCAVMLHAKSVVFACGAIERPLIFGGNDRPGVMLSSAAQIYLNRFALRPGGKALLATNNDQAYRTAIALASAGVEVTVADERPRLSAAVEAAVTGRSIDVRTGTVVAGTLGGRRISGAELARPGDNTPLRITCDLVCSSGGFTPTIHLTSHCGAKPSYDERIAAFVPGVLDAGQFGAGAMMGAFASAEVLRQGVAAGRDAAECCGFGSRDTELEPLVLEHELPDHPIRPPSPPSRIRGKAFVDLQNDVTLDDVRLAQREGYESVEHLKRYTTLGMGTDQGKTSNLNALALIAELRGASIPAVGTTTFRPPYTPVAIGALAGRAVGAHFKPTRRTPMHDWHVKNGAEMIEVGLWMRPWYYKSAGQTVSEAYIREMELVRKNAGIVDISTLGKIDVQGPDAVELLNRVYVNNWSNLAVGRVRYGVMLRDDGMVLDDGTVSRLDTHRFFMTTSTAQAGEVLSWLEFLLQTAWRDLRAHVTSVTDDFAGMAVSGPKSRAILQSAFPSIDLSNEALAHMGVVEGVWCNIPLRFARLSYSGELAYEVYVPSPQGGFVWERILAAGDSFDLQPYGVECLGALRIEKGHVAGPEIDGRTTLDDLGLSGMASKKKRFVGDVLRQRPAIADPGRRRLVGLECLEPGKRLRGGAILFASGETAAGHGRGHVTSVTYSPTLDRYIALALYEGGLSHEGEEVVAAYPVKRESTRARIVSPVFLDPEGERLRA
jgi:heterotetrameric sarcosine oxidase alpha subunit